MTGDKHKPVSTFMRWVETFRDGLFQFNKKGGKRIFSNIDKKYNRRWNRRQNKNNVNSEELYDK